MPLEASSHPAHTSRIRSLLKQDILKQSVAIELSDATCQWELDPVTLTCTLSSKTRKGGLSPLTIHNVNDFGNYDIEIDKLDGLLSKATNALTHETLPNDISEKAHYRPLISFLNTCVDACCDIYQKLFYEWLKFTVFNTEMQDEVLGASPLKPDGTGANGLSEGETKLW